MSRLWTLIKCKWKWSVYQVGCVYYVIMENVTNWIPACPWKYKKTYYIMHIIRLEALVLQEKGKIDTKTCNRPSCSWSPLFAICIYLETTATEKMSIGNPGITFDIIMKYCYLLAIINNT
jgi:hypothetical protein